MRFFSFALGKKVPKVFSDERNVAGEKKHQGKRIINPTLFCCYLILLKKKTSDISGISEI
jgi:hypothetical protein